MKLNLFIPIEIIEIGERYTRYNTVLREVNIFAIKRIPVSKKVKRFYYIAHYFMENDEVYSYRDSLFSKKIAQVSINRKENKKFNPTKLEFIDNIYKTGKGLV